jgi:signal transduction histidine kinase
MKTIIDNPYLSLEVNIDEEHLGMVIEKLCWLSVQGRTQGYSKARCEYRRGELLITIEDNGNGIPDEVKEHLFDRMSANNDTQTYGLSLPIIQALLQQMGGAIEIDSKMGQGTSVWVSLPCEARTIERKLEEITSNTTENILL